VLATTDGLARLPLQHLLRDCMHRWKWTLKLPFAHSAATVLV
jgi:hypothetical protein